MPTSRKRRTCTALYDGRPPKRALNVDHVATKDEVAALATRLAAVKLAAVTASTTYR
jgi:hypothetical protein